jgi:hypothetical protein
VVPLSVLTTASWIGDEGYWFLRPLAKNEMTPLVILGRKRTAAGPLFGTDVTDVVNSRAGTALRELLPKLFPGLFAPGRESEAKWVG